MMYEENYEEEELLSPEDEPSNWKGIVIAIAVIAAVLSLIILAIALVSPGPKKPDLGEPFTFDHLVDRSLVIEDPVYFVLEESNLYYIYNANDSQSHIAAVDINFSNGNQSESRSKVIISHYQLQAAGVHKVKNISPSPNRRYLLLACTSSTDGRDSSYRVYDIKADRIIEDSHFSGTVKLEFVSWIGQLEEMVYIKDNEILFKLSPSSNPELLERGGNSQIQVSANIHTSESGCIENKWLSPSNDKLVFVKLLHNESISTSPKLSLHVSTPYEASKKTQDLDLTNGLEFLTGIRWVNSTHILSTWSNSKLTSISFLLCNSLNGNCVKNLELSQSDLFWNIVTEPPVFNPEGSSYYTILPDPSNRNKMFRHIASIELDTSSRPSPAIKFITNYEWSDEKILDVIGSHIYYLSTGPNFTNRHVYRISLENRTVDCVTCNLKLDTSCLYTNAKFTRTKMLLSCLGPDLPKFYIISLMSLNTDKLKSMIVAGEMRNKVADILTPINLPHYEFVTVPLDSGFDASVRLTIPAVLDRSKIYTYGLVIRLSSQPGTQSSTNKYLDMFTIFLAKNQSYIVADVDVRGSANRGEKLAQAIRGGASIIEALDVQQIVKYFKEHWNTYKINSSMIAVMGKGYGGLVALQVMRKNISSCGIAISPMSSTADLGSFDLLRYSGHDSTNLAVSELKYTCGPADDCSMTPSKQNVLLIHGTIDDKIPYNNSLRIMRRLQLAGYDFKQQIYPDVGHDIELSSVYKHFYQTIVHYLQECFASSVTSSQMLSPLKCDGTKMSSC